MTILSNNCTAGVIYHSLGIRFDSPTINLWFTDEDFLAFVLDLAYYLKSDLIEDKEKEMTFGYPVGTLKGRKDITLYFMHYSSFDEAFSAWERRKRRIKNGKICAIMDMTNVDRPNERCLDLFDRITYPKIMLTRQPLRREESFAIELGDNPVIARIHSFEKWGHYFLDQFDYVSFLNQAFTIA